MLDTIELFSGLTRQELEQIATITVAAVVRHGDRNHLPTGRFFP